MQEGGGNATYGRVGSLQQHEHQTSEEKDERAGSARRYSAMDRELHGRQIYQTCA